MKLSIFIPPGALRRDVGYGTASYSLITTLQKQGFKVPFSDPDAPVQLWFCQPSFMYFREDQYNIAYTPWESTELPEGWKETFQKADEVWATSDAVKEWYEDNGISVSKVLYHGVEKDWIRPTYRHRGPVLKFLHVGEPAQRKGGQMVFDAFRAAFPGQDDVSLTIKANGHNEVRLYDGDGSIIGAPTVDPRVTVLNQTLDLNELVELYLAHDAMVYPSWGEGFGFIPLQAVVTGMPTITNGWWSGHYARYMHITNYQIEDSPWPGIHPGKMAKPHFDDVVDYMRDMYSNWSKYADAAIYNAGLAAEDFDWNLIVREGFRDFSKRF